MTASVLSNSLVDPIINFIHSLLASKELSRPLVLGISGPQGSGKTTLVNYLVEKLSAPPISLRVVAFSIDDIYLSHEELIALGRTNSENKLLQHRGEPGTHDVELGVETLEQLIKGVPTLIPSYDKSAYEGRGDRVSKEKWTVAEPPFDVILFEGWCVGFNAIPENLVNEKQDNSSSPGTLKAHDPSHLQFVNMKLRSYDRLWSKFHALVHLNAKDINYVYAWRLQQESAMRNLLGRGMSDEAVKEFVDGYMPAYELYIEGLLRGDVFKGTGRRILRMEFGKDREVTDVAEFEVK